MTKLALVLVFLARAAGENVIIAWHPSPAPDLKEYLVYWGQRPGQYTNALPVGKTTNATVRLARPGPYYLVVTATTTNGRESDPSEELVWPPAGNLTIQTAATPAGPWITWSNLNLPISNQNGYFRLRLEKTSFTNAL